MDPSLGLDFAAIRKQAVGEMTDGQVAEEFFASLVKAAALYFTQEENWDIGEYGVLMVWAATLEISYPVHLKMSTDTCEHITKALQNALGPRIQVERLEVDYRGGFAYGDLTCVQLSGD